MRNILCFIFSFMMSSSVLGQVSLQANDTVYSDVSTTVQHEHKTTKVTKAQGDSAYIRHDYTTAIQIYEMLLKEGESADVYYNLGNSYYKNDCIAKAILNYERALLLQPGDADIRANLEIARSKTVDKVAATPDVFFIAWGKSLLNCFSVEVWGKLGIISFWILLLALCLFLFSKRVIIKKIGFISGVILLFVVILTNAFASLQKRRFLERNSAIVSQPSVTVRSTPSDSGTSLFILHEGYKVEIKDNSMREWKEVQLEDGKVGWVPTVSIEVI